MIRLSQEAVLYTATYPYSGKYSMVLCFAEQDQLQGPVLAIGQLTSATFSVALDTSKQEVAAIVSATLYHIG